MPERTPNLLPYISYDLANNSFRDINIIPKKSYPKVAYNWRIMIDLNAGVSMKNSELLEIAREACTYAREHIKEGETTPRIKFYKKNADLLGKDFAETRRGYLKKISSPL